MTEGSDDPAEAPDPSLTGWARAMAALDLLACDPAALGGLWLRARSGPVRDRFLAALARRLPGARRIHPDIADTALYGGIDLAATLAAGHVVTTDGLAAKGGVLILTMAERCPPGLAARLAAILDAGGHALVALDEGAEPDEGLPAALADRLGLFVALDGLALADCPEPDRDPASARPLPLLPPGAAAAMTSAAATLGIASLRAPLLALAAARAAAAVAGRAEVTKADLARGAALVLAHRAAPPLPEAQDDPAPPPPDPPAGDRDDAPDPDPAGDRLPDEILAEAARAALPPDLLARLAAGRATRAARGGARGAGAARKGNRRGRPLPSRPGRLDGRARIDLVATLRSAAPWQGLRRAARAPGAPDRLLELRADDIRIRRTRETSDRLVIFAVDASGSAALARLAEAKGAVELLLAAAYVRRDHVALVSFRGTGAELLLPPTRSLVQTKRRLAGLPGGGGTPLAAGLSAALTLAGQARARGFAPQVAVLTDGRANIALDGRADRQAAETDAQTVARALRAAGVPAVLIDTGNRPAPALAALARTMDALYLPLPRADAARLAMLVAAAPEGG